ncbi:hypothetical protein [Gorillibacterium timonense]|uniref:hypothetical protein n=1 Tax=Gorillibacterium timonense TaxID=1689269 RepID=UPI0011DD8A10|nr:hypothetical protein [Gorillibacterium timonense]
MKLQIEKWVERVRPFDDNAEELFQESVICYKVGAYKSAFLMSYLSFKTTIKNRIISCQYRPDSYQGKEEEWQNNVLALLSNDDKWENHLNKIIDGDPDPQSTSTTRAVIFFSNREEAKNEYTYWKNVRNKCAHAKKGTIESSTVECFWNYIQDNLSKFYVLGGREHLVERLLEYYKYRDIEEYQTKLRLINDINIVFTNSAQDFFSTFLERFYGINRYLITSGNVAFWRDIVDSQYNDIQEGFVRSIMLESNYFISFYEHFPKVLNIAVSLERKFIKDSLSRWMGAWREFTGSNTNFWNILCVLLKNYPSDIDLNVIARLDLSIIENVELNDEMLRILKKNGVFNKFILSSGSYFFDVDFESIRRNNGRREREVIPWFEYVEWDKELILDMNRAFRNLNRNIESMRKSLYGSWEYDRKKIYCQLIDKYRERIDSVVIEELDLEDEFKALVTGSES